MGEDLADLMELNGYNVTEGKKSGDDAEIIATRIDEVGQEIVYVIRCKETEGPVDEAAVKHMAGVHESHPGSIGVVASDSDFTRDAQETAKKLGVRLWGDAEIENLRRNVARKRGQRRENIVEKAAAEATEDKPKSNRRIWKPLALLVVLVAALAYVYAYSSGPETIYDLVENLEDRIEDRIDLNGIVDTDLQNAYQTAYRWVEMTMEDMGLDRRIGEAAQKIRELA